MAPFTNFRHTGFLKAARGFTLIELAMSIAVFVIVGMATSSLMMAAVETQMSSRIHEIQHTIAMNVVDSLREDLRFARFIAPTGGNVLTFQDMRDPTGNTTLTYTYTGTTILRTSNNGAVPAINFSTAAPAEVPMVINCGTAGMSCFTTNSANPAVTPSTRASINELAIQHQVPGSSFSMIDRYFCQQTPGTPCGSRLRIFQSSFNILANSQFQ